LKRGYTILEFLVAAAILGLIAAATARAVSASLNFDSQLARSRDSVARSDAFEQRLRSLLALAHLSPDAAATDSFFIGSAGQPGSGGSLSSGSSTGDADTLTFTWSGSRLSGAAVSTEEDFETQNSRLGPQGGVAESTLSTTAFGDAGGRSGLFLRTQRPADGDPSQGGKETVFDTNIQSTKYEFFDGTDWQTVWDTRTQGTKRLPAAVRVTYRFSDEETDHIIVVRLPESDVTTDNPVTSGGA
jgi:prepilin-type N-terminal cleavage/methylation domain-containing protein